MSTNKIISLQNDSRKTQYSEDDYKNAVLSLNIEQREVFDNFIKRGYKTKWLYIFARSKGLLLSEEELYSLDIDEVNEIEQDLEWVFLDYKDYLERNYEVRCECGRALRHAYTVLNKSTGQIYVLGSNHFEQHTNINSEDVKNLSKSFRKIDLEKTEILEKVMEGRDINIISKVNKGFVIPKDISQLLEVNLPLLDSQINRLRHLGAFSDYEKEVARNKFSHVVTKNHEKQYYNERFTSEDNIREIINNKFSFNNLSEPDYIIDITEMIYKLESRRCSLEESEKYLNYLSYYKNSIDLGILDKNKIRTIFYSALGNIKPGELRNNLVEIQDLLEKICMTYTR